MIKKDTFDKEKFKKELESNVRMLFRRKLEEATPQQIYQAVAYSVKDDIIDNWIETHKAYEKQDKKMVYYMSMEFLMGRALGNNMINLLCYDDVRETLEELGLDLNLIEDQEPDAALGNGGLGRLAACFLDSLATLGYPAYGCGIRYRYGMFKQKIENGYQVEVPDNWLKYGNPFEIKRDEYAVEVKFGGYVDVEMHNGRQKFVQKGYQSVRAVPYDMPIVGYGNHIVNTLRIWDAEAINNFNLDSFDKGEYQKAVEQENLARTICEVLYPNDNHMAGKELRLKQQYFFISASVQRAIAKYKETHDDIRKFHEKVTFQLNDTHPTVAVAELMRILVDEEGLEWDEAWEITRKTCAYTNHTIMAEALEKWPIELFSRLLPRVYQIVEEINRRFVIEIQNKYPGDQEKIRKMAILYDGQVRMAHLAIAGSYSVNGVARLHTDILKKRELKDFYEMMPEKFNNKTNGITQRRFLLHGNPLLASWVTDKIGDDWITNLDHLKHLKDFYEMMPEKFNNKTNGITQRRFLLHGNPLLASWVTDKIGDDWITNLDHLKHLKVYVDDEKCQQEFMNIKYQNKVRLAKYIKEHNGIDVDPRSIFDCQVKRLHEYKRQLMNILHVMYLYNEIKAHPDMDIVPRTFIFGAKAAAGYYTAKLTIKLINAVADKINNDPSINGKIKVVFIEDYRVSNAELIFAAADVSEQISTASKEASGTGNMKFMLNGALTLGTMDGANVEIVEEVGKENAFIFGLSADQVMEYEKNGNYNPRDVYNNNQDVRQVLTQLVNGFYSPENPELFRALYDALLEKDTYFTLLDFDSYKEAHNRIDAAYRDEEHWARTAMLQTASAGKFSSDRTIEEYAKEMWHLEKVTL